ncbi:ribosomal RNA-processing protein 14-C [Aplysia californica]|uniref:Ribosomal RNA-processing protein 14-C n=1 Tax=Aplysia californica TaxID=6500 RepID=A0ABM0JFZ6_APLCA|nr:ribosomal RNA-processing protein 14-C [Aplysia californica]
MCKSLPKAEEVNTDTMSDEEDMILDQVKRDNNHFKGLLDLIPPQSYFSQEEKDEIWGNNTDTGDSNEAGFGSKKKKQHNRKKSGAVSLSSLTVTQITELRQKGLTVGSTKRNEVGTEQSSDASGPGSSIAAKHEGKKQSRTQKNKKNKGKEMQRRENRLEELKQKLQVKLEEMKARKSAGNPVNAQEQKKLKRQEKKVNSKLKQKNKNHKVEPQGNKLADGLRSPPQNKILNENGDPVKSKFDFSVISFGNDKSKSNDLQGRDYKRLLEKVERRKEKVEKLKEKDLEAGKKLEEKIQWQTVMSKAQGEKVKDDPTLLKKAAKKKDKIKEKKKRKWGDRAKTVEEQQKKKQDRRQANLDKRKSDNKDKKRKKMIKKGRIIPGF